MKRIFLSLSLIFVIGCSGSGSSSLEAGGVGGPMLKPSQRFTLKDTTGQDVSLDGLLKTNKAVLLSFWATWCGYCKAEIPNLNGLQDKYGSRSFTVVGIDEGESAQKVASFTAKSGMNYPQLLDEEMEVGSSYGVVGIPTLILIRSDGQVLGVFNGTHPKLNSLIEQALA